MPFTFQVYFCVVCRTSRPRCSLFSSRIYFRDGNIGVGQVSDIHLHSWHFSGSFTTTRLDAGSKIHATTKMLTLFINVLLDGAMSQTNHLSMSSLPKPVSSSSFSFVRDSRIHLKESNIPLERHSQETSRRTLANHLEVPIVHFPCYLFVVLPARIRLVVLP